METILLPDGTTIQVSSSLTAEDRRKLDQEIRNAFNVDPSPSVGAIREASGSPAPRMADFSSAGLASLTTRRERQQALEEEGTVLGSLWEGIKSIPRGARQFGLLAQQGIAALRTPDEDTEREKDLRRRLDELYGEIDPRYRDANLPQLGMGLGQVAAMVGTSLIPFIGKPTAIAGAALMGAGEQAGRIADFEERTGEDVASGKELLALAGGLGIGLTEMAPLGKFAKRFKLAGALPATGREAAESISKRVQRRAGMTLLERAAEDAGGLATKAIKTGLQEAAQEGTAGFAQSGLAYYLYDDEAMADAGTNALKEAIIGGETGAVADVIFSMVAGSRRGLRRHSEKRMKDSLDKETARAVQDMREGKLLDKQDISDLVTSTDPAKQAVVESVMDGSFTAEAQMQSEAAQREIREDPDLTDDVRDQKLADEVREIRNLYREVGIMRAGITAYREGRLALEDDVELERAEEVQDVEALTQPTEAAPETEGLKKPVDVIRNKNYLERLKTLVTGSLFRQENVDDALRHLPFSKSRADDTGSEIYMANTPDLALGQGQNKDGLIIEFEPGELQGQINRIPTWEALYEQGLAEFVARLNQQSDYQNAAKSVTVPDNLQVDSLQRRQLTERIAQLEEAGWVSETVDGGVKYTRPTEAPAPEAEVGSFDAGDVLDQIWWRLRPTRAEVEARERARLVEIGGLSDSEIDAQVKEAGDAVQQGEDDVLDVQQRLATEEQRVALRELWEATESGDVRLSPAQARATVDAILQGGVYDLGDVTWKTTPEGAPAAVVDNAARVAEGTPATAEDTQRASDTANSVLSSVMGFRSLLEINDQIEGLKRDEVTDADRRQLANHIDDIETGKIVDELVANELDVTQGLAQRALDAKGITLDLDSYVAETLEMDPDTVDWNNLREGERHAVMSRILRTTAQESTTRTDERVQIAEELRQEGRERTEAQLERDAKNIQNAKDRITLFKEEARAELTKMGKSETALKIAVAADSIYATIKEIYNDPDIIVESRAYDNAPSASVRNHGTMILFNLSQMEGRYKDGINTPVETLVKDTAFHEGAHLWYLNDDLSIAEQRSLERYGKREKVPEAASKEAHEQGMTWRQWTESLYGKDDPNLIEETSVRILDALAQGHIPPAKSAGFMSKIASDLSARSKAVVGAARESDILSAMKVFEKVQNGELKRRSEARQQEVGGVSSLQVLDRATPEQFQALTEAAQSGSETEVENVARDIVRSRVEAPTVSLQQSLINEFRARREIEETPGSVLPVLNKHAIEAGKISATALNAYFEFRDGRVADYKFLEGIRHKADKSGYTTQFINDGIGDRIGSPTKDGGAQAVEASGQTGEGQQNAVKKDGRWRPIRSRKDFKDRMLYTKSEMLRFFFFDKRLPQWLSHEQKKLRETALGQLAESSAIAAWRVADSALTYLSPQMEYGPLVWDVPKGADPTDPSVGGIKFGEDLTVTDPDTGEVRQVKGFKYIAQPLIEAGKSVQRAAHAFLIAHRIVSTRELRNEAHNALKNAKALNQATPDGTRKPFNKNQIKALEAEAKLWTDRYNKVNASKTYTVIDPKTGKKQTRTRRFLPLDPYKDPKTGKTKPGARTIIQKIEAGVLNGEQDAIIIQNFKTEYGDFNHHQIEFLRKTGTISEAKKITLQRLAYVPFYRDQGWDKAQPFWNDNNENSEKQLMIDQALEGSFDPIDPNMFGQMISNMTAITRDGLWNIAVQRTMRDEVDGGTAVEITNQNRSGPEKTKLDEAGFSDIKVRFKIDGQTKEFRVKDPLLAQSIMTSGFSPTRTIETFFGKVFRAGGRTFGVRNESIAKGLTNLLVVPSNALRELVTRSPPFIVKNILRDSMQASVTFGGGPIMTLKAFANVIKPGLLEEAQKRGISQPIDYSPDSDQFGKRAQKFLSRDQVRGITEGPIPFVSTVWDWLGQFARKSEVAARMVVYDKVMEDTGNSYEAMVQAMEIMNYGRRGSSQFFTTFAAMAPFVNGRIQGLDVVLRTHLGSLDAPGLYDKKFDASARGRAMRAGTAFTRGSYIAFGTFMYWLMVRDDEEYKNAREDEKNDWWLIPAGPGETGFKIPIPFEVGLLYKVIPEQIFRTMAEQEHDFRDMRDEMGRQIFNTLWLDLRPQAIRPMIDAAFNRNAFTGDQIVPSWMDNTVAASEQYNPYTNEVARMVGQKLDGIPLLNNMTFLTSPMKLEYMLRQYGGTIGSYAIVMADRLARKAGDKNVVGTAADFELPLFDYNPLDVLTGKDSIDPHSWDKLPILGDLLWDPDKGGGYQESFYEMVEEVDEVVATLREMEKRIPRDRTREDEYEERHEPLYIAERRIKHFEKRMDHWRGDRDRLFTRNDLSDEEKRRVLYRMFEQRDDMLEEMLKLMADVRADRTFAEKLIGTGPG